MPATPTIQAWNALAPYLDTTLTVAVVFFLLWRAGLLRKKNGREPGCHVSTEVFNIRMAEFGGALGRIEDGVTAVKDEVRSLAADHSKLQNKTDVLEERINQHMRIWDGVADRRRTV